MNNSSNGFALSQPGHKQHTIIVPVKPINKISKRASKKPIQQMTLSLTNPPLPVGLNNDKPKRSRQDKKRAKALLAKKRADELKCTYPDMKDVPDSLTNKHRVELVRAYKHSQMSQSQAEQELLNPARSLSSKGSRIESFPEVTEDRRKEVARTLGGLSNSDPIFID